MRFCGELSGFKVISSFSSLLVVCVVQLQVALQLELNLSLLGYLGYRLFRPSRRAFSAALHMLEILVLGFA